MNLDATQMQLRYKLELRCQLDRFRYSLNNVEMPFRLGVGGKIIPMIKLPSANVMFEDEAELGNYRNTEIMSQIID